ncbi:MAG TPA: bifunctional diaminohydroxyphosphoribosylaminopyrimidine deaminase/5-amino-6-(5-phosphoribosylamino)uracil reductase RibD [Planctomycetota bacterium]|nr:bifunctional diaminohydroxyphosphoribosylaminopyrimidine deaminase/5-amino-6-(5-phosphoribosylamino)uracil reductase RibD [Planctomycetota bacterium]
MTEFDDRMMRRALELAERGLGRVEPNPAVGAVLVQGDRIVGEGYHRVFGGPHAEVHALEAAGDAARGATLYVTLEPCCHHGKTPPCTDALIAAGVRRVVVAMQDPFPKVAGTGLAQLRDAGIRVEVGLRENEAMRLNRPYLKLNLRGLPWFTAKWAMTLDGKIATATGDSRWISGEKSRQFVHRLRDRADAVLIGVETAIKDDPLLTCRFPGGRNPRRIVVDTRARLPLDSKLVGSIDDAPLWVVTGRKAPRKNRDALAAAGCRLIELPETSRGVDLAALAETLGREPLTHVLVEGGGRIHASLFESRLIDHVVVFVAPKLVGGEHAPTPVAGPGVKSVARAWTVTDVSVNRLDEDILVEGDVRYEVGG